MSILEALPASEELFGEDSPTSLITRTQEFAQLVKNSRENGGLPMWKTVFSLLKRYLDLPTQ